VVKIFFDRPGVDSVAVLQHRQRLYFPQCSRYQESSLMKNASCQKLPALFRDFAAMVFSFLAAFLA